MANPVPLVLVADDEPSMREMVARHLQTMSNPRVEVIEASDGEQALRIARERLPDLVVLDVMMPEMSGWEVCKKIREDISLAHTGVVMLTGIGENLNQLTSPLYGADAYIDKPFEFDELDRKVKEALSARASQREGVPRVSGLNGVAGPAKAAKKKKKPAKKKAVAAKKAKPAQAKKKTAKKTKPAKKSAKKPVKKAAKKPATKKKKKKR